MSDRFDAGYCLDVLEHISPSNEDKFITNAVNSLKRSIFVVGMPSWSRKLTPLNCQELGHVNCKTQKISQ